MYIISVTEKFGNEGCLLFLQLLNYIPKSLLKYRLECVTDILGVGLTTTTLKTSELDDLMKYSNTVAAEFNDLLGKPSMQLLWKASFEKNKPLTLFLAPPVETCLVCESRLTTHNQPTTSLCFTRDGPLPALKITLKCPKCLTNYRLAIYKF